MLCSRASNLEQIRLQPSSSGVWVARSALAVEHVQFHWALAQITNHKKQRSGGLGLEQKEEPAAAWWSDHRLLVLWWGSFLKLLMLVVGGWCLGWWAEQQWRHCSLRFQGLSLVSMSRCGVYAGWLEPSETWDVELKEMQHQIEGPEGFSLFVSISVMKVGLCLCFCLCLIAQVKSVLQMECRVFILSAMRWNMISLSYKMWVLHVKNKWPLCHAWHHADMNC